MNFKIFTLIASLLISTSILAGTHTLRSSNISLIGSASLKPRETLNVTLDKLMDDVEYAVVCKIKDPNNKKNPAYIKTSETSTDWYSYYMYPSINGSAMYNNQGKLTQIDNILEFCSVNNRTSFAITNLDQDDTLEVESCVATPVVNDNDIW